MPLFIMRSCLDLTWIKEIYRSIANFAIVNTGNFFFNMYHIRVTPRKMILLELIIYDSLSSLNCQNPIFALNTWTD